MNLTGITLKNNRVTILCLFVIMILGLTEYQQLSRDSMPSFTVRTASIITQFPGATPERVESLISDKIEKVIQEIPEVKTIISTNRTSLSVIKVSLYDYVNEKDIQSLWDQARRKIESIKSDLPDGITGPDLNDEDIGVVYGIFVGLESDGFEYNEIKKYANDLRDELITLDDAAKVIIGGETKEQVYIEYEDAQLSKFGLSAVKLQRIISSSNIIIPSGEVRLGKEKITVESSGNFESIDAIKKLLITTGNNNETIPLGEITNIRRGYITPKKNIVRINGKDALALYVSLKENANIIHLGERIDELLLKYNKKLPIGISAKRIASQDKDVQQKVDIFVGNLIQSIIIVLFVVLLILGWRAGVVIASLIPTTMIMTFWTMSLFGVGLNQVTLASLIMALGLLVDNGIVMTESLLEKLEKGQSKFEAAVNSCKEFMIPLLISSLTTSAAFMSFFLAQSIMGEIMGNIFLVITMALLSSWLLAFTVIPIFGTAFLKVKHHKNNKKTAFDRINVYYNRLLNVSLTKPWWVMISIIILFVLATYGFSKVPSIFMPPNDRHLITLEMNLPLGTSIEQTDENIATIEQFIKDSLLVEKERGKGILSWSSYIGKGPKPYDLGYRQDQPNTSYAYMLLNTSSSQANKLVISKLSSFSKRTLFDADIKVKRLTGAGGADVPIEVRLSGDDPDELFNIADEIKVKLAKIQGTSNVGDNWGPKIKKVFVNIDDNKLSKSQLTNQDVALSLNTALSGFKVGDYREGENNIPIVMTNQNSQGLSYSDLETLLIYSQSTGTSVPLVQVASISPEWVFSKILKRNLKRSLTIESEVTPGYITTDIVNELSSWLSDQSKTWKPGYTYELGGDAESSNDAMGAIMVNLPFSFFIIILLLVLQFNSIRKATIIFSTIPLAIIGVAGGLLSTDSFFSFTAFLGIISLAGIIVNDAIVLVDKIGLEIALGNTLEASIIKASNDRFSPILLTTLTTSCGMIPLWTGGGELWSPLAISVIFGLLFATIILLIFVPVIYLILFKKRTD